MHNNLRQIRSYVLRGGRLTKGQRFAIDNYWCKHGIEFTQSEINLNHLFNRRSPKILDIGTGMGDTTANIASNHPENDYLAVEVHRPGIGNLLNQIELKKLSNIKIIEHDIMDVLQHQLPRYCLDAVYIFFPDPWPKKRHHKRRLINLKFLDVLQGKLKSHAIIFLATDWEDYAQHILDVFEKNPVFINLAGKHNAAPRPYWRPVTRFEQRGIKLQHDVQNFAFCLARNY